MADKNPVIAVYSRSSYPAKTLKATTENFIDTKVNSLIIAGPNGYSGTYDKKSYENYIVYNDPPFFMFDNCGTYIGDPDWAESLKHFIAETKIPADQIFYSLSNSAISAMAAIDDAALAKEVAWLQDHGIAGIDMDCESWGQSGGLCPMDKACQTVTLAAIKAGLSLTSAPYNRMDEWVNWIRFVRENNGNLRWLNVQCYAGGAYNDPVSWFKEFTPSVPVLAGLEGDPGTDCNHVTPQKAQSLLYNWQQENPENSLSGAFLWLYSTVMEGPYSVKIFAEDMYNGAIGRAPAAG